MNIFADKNFCVSLIFNIFAYKNVRDLPPILYDIYSKNVYKCICSRIKKFAVPMIVSRFSR